MLLQEEQYHTSGKSIANSLESQMFGNLCYKIQCKAFCSLFENEMVFKLNEPHHNNAMQLEGSKLFDPSGKKRPMKELVQISFAHQDLWPEIAAAASKYVLSKL